MGLVDPQIIDAIRGFEGYSPQAQWDYKQSSSGYGTRAQSGDENLPPDQLKAIHEQRLQDEVAKAAAVVDSFAPNLPPGVRSALTSLTYNAGPGWQQSGLGEAVKAGDLDKAQQIFLQYNKAGGEVNPGLVARRQKEAAWFGQLPQAAAPSSPIASAIMGQPQAPVAPPPATAGAVAGQIMGQQPQAPPSSPFDLSPPVGGPMAQPPAQQGPQLAPIMFAQRRAPDLSKLRAAFGSFSQG